VVGGLWDVGCGLWALRALRALWALGLGLGRISWLRRVRLENPLGRGNFVSGLKLSGERDDGLGLARFLAVCPLDGHMHANGLLWHAGMAGAACMGLTT
jgi:hypothetical protein